MIGTTIFFPFILLDTYVFARPSGKRCLVVSTNGMTVSRGRNGTILHRFPSALPNGSSKDTSGPASYSILDCIFQEVPKPNTFPFSFGAIYLYSLAASVCFLTFLFCLWCSLMKHTTSSTWFVGEAIRCMIAPQSSGFSGWILSSQKLLPAILHQHITDINSVSSLYMNALFRVFKQHT